MATHYDAHHPIEVSVDDARGGVTGHNVRYVLGFGLTGIFVAFAAIAIYFGFDQLQDKAAAAFAASPSEILRSLAPNAAIMLIGAIGAGLLLGLWHVLAGGSRDGSQSFMRARVVAQFALVCVIMAMFYVAG